jgi:WhiB family redox-sensing transcriptional regulator
MKEVTVVLCTYPAEISTEQVTDGCAVIEPADGCAVIEPADGCAVIEPADGCAVIDRTGGRAVVDSTIDPAYGVNIPGIPCQVLDPDLWFAETPTELESAKTHCSACPVRAGCLAGALQRREPWGVWGGEIFDQGAIVARKRPRGRPRKEVTEVAA